MWAIFPRMTRIGTRLGVNTVQAASVLWQEEEGDRKHVVFDPSTQACNQSAVDMLQNEKNSTRPAQMQGRQHLA